MRASTFPRNLPPNLNHMDVVFDIHEGEKVIVDRGLVTGLSATRSKVVDRELKVHPATHSVSADLFTTQQQLYDLGIFSQVDVAIARSGGPRTKQECTGRYYP